MNYAPEGNNSMKKSAAFIVATLGAVSMSSAASASDLYIGLDVFGSHNRFDYDYAGLTQKTDIDSSGLKLKLGALLVYDLRLQGYVLTEKFDEPPFDYTNDRLTEIGLDLIKEFVVSPQFSPFIQGGIGYGTMDLDRRYYDDDYIEEVNLKVGIGLMFRVTPSVELLTGIDFQWRGWSDVYYNNVKMETEDGSQRFYVGIDFLF